MSGTSKRRRIKITKVSLYKEYLKVVKKRPFKYQTFQQLIAKWFTFSQICKIIPAWLWERKKFKWYPEKPITILPKEDSQEREKYWRDYFLNELKNERITD